MTTIADEQRTFSNAANEYRYLYRYTPLPFDTKTNRTPGGYKWTQYQDGVPEDKHKEWIANDEFNKGIAIILGKARDRKDCFIFAIDLDGKSAIEQFCLREDGSKTTLEELSKIFKVEQHSDDPFSAHIIGYTNKPLKTKYVITKKNKDPKLTEKIEVKADSGHLINISPSVHKDGYRWSDIGEKKIPSIINKEEIEKQLIDVFKRNGADYQSTKKNDNVFISREQNERTNEDLTKDQFEQVLIDKYHFKATKDTEDLYYYDKSKGIYVRHAEWLIKKESLVYNPGIACASVNEIKEHIIWANYIDRSELDANIEWLCCKNCMINLLTGETRPFSPDFMTTVQIPHDYIISKAPFLHPPRKIMQFLHQVMTYDDVETVLDFMAYCLWRGFPFHRWLLFNGSGRNGKGVLTRLITKLLGRLNVSNETLHRILESRFASAKLYGKMANIDADMSKEELKHTGMLKMLTGDDDIPAEFKFKDPFSFRNYAKLIFSANTMPVTPDETDAFFARLIIINFPNQYLGDKANPYLIDELTTEAEMSALLSVLIKRLPHVLKAGIYTPHSSIEENYIKYMESSNPIKLFAEMVIRATTGSYQTKTDVYSSYVKFCDQKGLGKESSETFSRRLMSLGFEHKPQKVNGVKTHVWINVKLIDYTKVDDDQETLT